MEEDNTSDVCVCVCVCVQWIKIFHTKHLLNANCLVGREVCKSPDLPGQRSSCGAFLPLLHHPP